MALQSPIRNPQSAIHNRKGRSSLLIENTLLAFGTLRDRGFRSFLTVLGVFIGVVIIVAVASVLNGFRQSIVDDIQQFGTSLIYVQKIPPLQMRRPTSAERNRKNITLDDALAIRDECDAVASITPVVTYFSASGAVKYEGDEVEGVYIQGGFPSMANVASIEIAEGRFLGEEEEQRGAPVGVIGHALAESLFPHRSALGKTVIADGHRIRVIGVLEKFLQPALGGGENIRDRMVYVPYTWFHRTFPWQRDHEIMARAHEGKLREAVDQIEEVMRRRRRVAWKNPNDFDVSTAQSMTAQFDKIIFATLAVMFALSTVAFMVGGIGVMNVMLASVKERTREIGVRRAIGARRRDITWQFLIEAMAMTAVGGILGVLAGEFFMRGIHALLPQIPCAVPMWARFFGFFGSVGVGLVFGLWPAMAAARLDPIEALRYE